MPHLFRSPPGAARRRVGESTGDSVRAGPRQGTGESRGSGKEARQHRDREVAARCAALRRAAPEDEVVKLFAVIERGGKEKEQEEREEELGSHIGRRHRSSREM